MGTLAEKYNDLMEKADPRVEGLFMMSWPPGISAAICLFYVFFVKYLGPKYMENRAPYKLKELMLIYNFAMVILSGYTFLEFGLAGWLTGYSYGCQPVDYSRSPEAMRMVHICNIFHLTKYIELLDTVIFVLRKKYNQVTFLHVFHHGVMPVSWWIGVKFVPGGFGTFHAWLNSFIHFVMYFYYALAALGPNVQKYLWWKKYITKLQMIQFILVTIHSTQLLFIDCNYPMLFCIWIWLYAVIFLAMFANFYINAYKKKPKTSKKEESLTNGHKHTYEEAVLNGKKQ